MLDSSYLIVLVLLTSVSIWSNVLQLRIFEVAKISIVSSNP